MEKFAIVEKVVIVNLDTNVVVKKIPTSLDYV